MKIGNIEWFIKKKRARKRDSIIRDLPLLSNEQNFITLSLYYSLKPKQV
jgi:hypothetical protein